MTQLGELTGTLDGLVGLASAAVNSPEPWTRPQFCKETALNLTGLRHPLLEQEKVLNTNLHMNIVLRLFR